MSGARGAWEMLYFSLSLMNRLSKTESAIFISLFCFSCSHGIDIYRILINTTAGIKCCVATVKSCPNLSQCCYILFWSSVSRTPKHLVLRSEYHLSPIKLSLQISFLYFGLLCCSWGINFYQNWFFKDNSICLNMMEKFNLLCKLERI